MLTIVTPSSSSHQPLKLQVQAPPCFTLSHLTILITNNAGWGRKERRGREGRSVGVRWEEDIETEGEMENMGICWLWGGARSMELGKVGRRVGSRK
jgi:hypothetical protein